ncbi:MAG: hypothetical protein OSB21_06220 [Myxococcota bacterium]|nr:hypothetical protein [Myxococcota bacterium]
MIRFLTLCLAVSACSGDEPPPQPPVGDAGVTVPDGGVGSCGDSWLLTYRINGNFYITDTTASMGNADRPLSEGTLVLRVPDNAGQPDDGEIQLISFSHGERFTVTAFGIETVSDVDVRGGPHPCGIALGSRSEETLTWERCTPSASQGVDKNSWTPDDAAEGPGCLRDYSTSGNVACEGIMCDIGGLSVGDNPQAERYNQPLEPFAFIGGWDGFSMARSEIPNRTPSRTWFDLNGVLVDQQLDNIPACLCEL